MTSTTRNLSPRPLARALPATPPSTVAVRLFRPSVARDIVRSPIRHRLHTHSALGQTRAISITR